MSGIEGKQLFKVEARTFPQERARKTFEGLVASAHQVFRERGFDATQTPDIAAGAGVSVGTFYRYFSDKHEIFMEILRRHLAKAHTEVMAELNPASFVGQNPRQLIDKALRILVANTTREPKMQRVFAEMSMRDEKVLGLWRTFDDEARSRIAELLTVLCPRDLVPDPEATAYVVQTATVELALSLAGARGPAPLEADRSINAMVALLHQGLFDRD